MVSFVGNKAVSVPCGSKTCGYRDLLEVSAGANIKYQHHFIILILGFRLLNNLDYNLT